MKGSDNMGNKEILIEFCKRYSNLAFTHNYIFGFIYKDTVYFYITGELLYIGVKLSEASRNQGLSIRYRPTVEEKEGLIRFGIARPFCLTDYFLKQVNNSKYNRGEIFEKLITEKLGYTWTKDNTPFTESGDIVYKNTHYQIKFENATFTTEKTLYRLESIKNGG